jgi:streptogramin lyase
VKIEIFITIKPIDKMKKTLQYSLLLMLSMAFCFNSWGQISCGTIETNIDNKILNIIQTATPRTALARVAAENFREVRIAIVVDSTVYFQYNRDTTKIKEAAYRTYRTASAYYERDFNVRFNVVSFEFLTKNRSYNERNNTFTAFNKIRADYQNRTDINRDILILWSVALKEPYGGVASGIGNVGTNGSIIHMLNYFGNGEPLMGTVLHEIGHVMGSVHTQSCTWASGPFEVCTDVEGSCKGWAIDTRYASIMSYCADGDLVFHPLCKDVIKKVANLRFMPMTGLPSATPVLQYPRNGITEFYPSDFFQWKSSEKVSNYQVVISENADLSNPLIDSLVADNMIYVDKTLKRNTTYYWRVRAKNQNGDGSWSAISNFKTHTNLILKAPFMEPISEDKTHENKVISFRKVTDAKEYSIEIHKGSAITNTSLFAEKRVTTNKVRIETILPAISTNLNAQYTFRVRALADTSKSEWSNNTKEFFFYQTKINVTPNSVLIPINPILAISANLPRSSQKRTYDYEISKTSDFKVIEAKKTVQYNSYFQVPNVDSYASFALENLAPSQQYFYRLKAKNEADSTNTWTTGTFTTSYENRWATTHAGNSVLPFGASTLGLFIDSKNNKWIFGNQGVLKKSPDGTIEQFTRERTSDLLANTVTEISEDEQGRIWFATSDGVTKLENGLFTRYESVLWGTIDALGKSVDRYMYGITTGKNGINYAYVSTGKVIKFQNGFWTNITGTNSFSSNAPQLRQDANGNLWVALYNYSTRASTFRLYDGTNWSDFKPNWSFLTGVQVPIIDNKGNIWYSDNSKDSVYVVKDKNSYKSYFKTIKAINEQTNTETTLDLRNFMGQVFDTGTKIYFFTIFSSAYVEFDGTTYRYKLYPQNATLSRSYQNKMFAVDKNDALSFIQNSSVIYEQNKNNIIANFTDKQTFASCNVKFRIGVAYPPTGDATTTKLKVMLSDGSANTFKDITATYSNGEITAKIPANTPVGKGFRLKFTMGGDWYVSNESAAFEVVATPAAVITGTNQFCIGTTTALTASASTGKAPFTYAWYTGTTQTTDNTDKITVSKSGDYSVIITDANGCAYNAPVLKVSEKGATATITPDGQTAVYQPNTVKLNANTVANATYQWQRNTTDIAGATATNLEAKESGDYAVTLKVDGCTSVSSAVKVAIDILLGTLNEPNVEILPYPNPTDNVIRLNLSTIKKTASLISLELFDIKGISIWQKESRETQEEVDATTLKSGVYILKIKSGEYQSIHKIIKQ